MACTKAQLEAARRYREKNRGLIREKRKERYSREAAASALRRSTPEGWAKARIVSIRHRAKRTGIEFSIDYSDILPTETCPVLGIPLKLVVGQKGSRVPADAASVDRIDNSKGYVKGNVRVISNRANILKKDATVEEAKAIYLYMLGGI